jgi:hypothetical protein
MTAIQNVFIRRRTYCPCAGIEVRLYISDLCPIPVRTVCALSDKTIYTSKGPGSAVTGCFLSVSYERDCLSLEELCSSDRFAIK